MSSSSSSSSPGACNSDVLFSVSHLLVHMLQYLDCSLLVINRRVNRIWNDAVANNSLAWRGVSQVHGIPHRGNCFTLSVPSQTPADAHSTLFQSFVSSIRRFHLVSKCYISLEVSNEEFARQYLSDLMLQLCNSMHHLTTLSITTSTQHSLLAQLFQLVARNLHLTSLAIGGPIANPRDAIPSYPETVYPAIQHLSLYKLYYGLDVNGAAFPLINLFPNLTELHLVKLFVAEKDLVDVFQATDHFRQLRVLALLSCFNDSEPATALSGAVFELFTASRFPALVKLNLAGTKFRDDVTWQWLSQCDQLTNLNLSYTKTCSSETVEAIQQLNSLTELSLMEALHQDSMISALYQPSLHQLCSRLTTFHFGYGDTTISDISSRPELERHILNILPLCCHLRHLTLPYGSNIELYRCLAAHCRELQSIRWLWMENSCTPNFSYAALQQLATINSLSHYYLEDEPQLGSLFDGITLKSFCFLMDLPQLKTLFSASAKWTRSTTGYRQYGKLAQCFLQHNCLLYDCTFTAQQKATIKNIVEESGELREAFRKEDAQPVSPKPSHPPLEHPPSVSADSGRALSPPPRAASLTCVVA